MANVNTNGFIQDVTILSTPNYVFGNQTLASYLSNVSVKIRVERSGGLSENITTTLLALVGDTVTLTISLQDGSNPETITFGLFEVQHNDTFPNYTTSIKLLKLAFSNWTFYNTELGQTYAVHFEYTQNFHPMSYKFAGEFVIDEIQKDIDTFYVNGYSSAVPSSNGSLYDLFGHIKVIDNNQNEYDLWDLAKYGFTIKTNKSSYGTATTITGGNETIIMSTTLGKFFSHCDMQNAFTKITITISYWDTSNEIDRTLSVEFNINLNGITTLTCSGLGDFVEQNANAGMVRINIITTNGMGYIDVPASLENYFNSYTFSFLNTDTSQSYSLGNLLPNGHYTVTIGLVINPMWTKTASGTIGIYEQNATSIEANLLNENFRVGTIFYDTQLIVYARYLIYGNDYVKLRIYYPNYSSDYNGHRFVGNDYPNVEITVTYGLLTTTVTAYLYYAEKDELWVYNKKTLLKTNYGEIQQDFNMNFVSDGTKDNAKVRVLNHIQADIKPNTIAYMPSTDTWWIVKEDKVTRYDNERNPLWQHDVSLLGVIEILNSRDLTNCGFNVNHYTIEQFFNRLIKLCDFELPLEFDFGTYINPQQNVDYLKTFENYSPLSALKEMCDGINVKPKMLIQTTNSDFTQIEKAIIYFIPNSGINNAKINITEFDDSQEIITSNKENYGSKVVSNVQNVVSGKSIRYPAVGTVHISSETNKVTYESALLRLPTKANYVESLEICGKYVVYIEVKSSNSQNSYTFAVRSNSDCYNDADFTSMINSLKSDISSNLVITNATKSYLLDYLTNNKDQIRNIVYDGAKIVLKNGADYAQIDNTDNWSGEWNGKQVELAFNGTLSDQVNGHPGIGLNRSNSIGLNDKKHYDSFPQQVCMIYWEQGSDLIKNFRFFDKFTSNQSGYTKPVVNDTTLQLTTELTSDDITIGVTLGSKTYGSPDDQDPLSKIGGINLIDTYEATYVVHYIPMTNLKLKIENGVFENDSHLYNQNGTMISSKAISKLLNSHAESISSNEITRYKRYYDFFSIPQIGQVVNNNGVDYIINNVSIDFVENDNNDYVLDCQFTMTKQIACKSTMISANTNIRDYKTPQDNNIYRTQNYRDLIYFDYTQIENETYMPLKNLFNVPAPYVIRANKGYVDTHTALMKIDWDKNKTNYYQLPCIKYELEKMVTEIIDFKDNNIIGYAVNNTTHPFQVSTWWVATDLIQVPVSYVDDVGHLIGLDILMCDNSQLTSAYDDLGYDGIYSASCIIPQTLYEQIGSYYDAKISEPDYDKDGLEIPMFIYSCQILNNNGIVVASDFFNSETLSGANVYCYIYDIVDERITEQNAMSLLKDNLMPTINGTTLNVPQEIIIDNSNVNLLSINMNTNVSININTGVATRTAYTQHIKHKNIAIYRCKIDLFRNEKEISFAFGINDCKVNLNVLNALVLYENGKKL